MADTKISGMTPGSALTGAELLEMVQSGGTFSTTATAMKAWVLANPVVITGAVGSSALSVSGNTQTASFPLISGTQTWNNVAITFTALKFNVTDTTSAAASLLADLQVGAASKFSIDKTGAVIQGGSTTYSAIAAGPVLKRGSNGRVGTFTCNGVTPVSVGNTSVAITDAILISLNTVGGTVGALPAIQTITASTGFTVAGTSGDSSVYNYAILKNAA